MTIRNWMLPLAATLILGCGMQLASAVTCDGGTCTFLGDGTSTTTIGGFKPQDTINSITNTWNQTPGTVPAGTDANLGQQNVPWTGTGGAQLSLSAFYVPDPVQNPTLSNQATVAFSGAGNGGFGVCSHLETCTSQETGLQIEYGTGSGTNLDILQVAFGSTTWKPVGASVDNTNGPIDFVIYASDTSLQDSILAGKNYNQWLSTLTFLGANEDNALCGTPEGNYSFYGFDSAKQVNPPGPTQSTNFVCTQKGNSDQYYFNNQQTFQYLFFVIDTATAPLPGSSGSSTGNESFFVTDIEGVNIPEPGALTLLGTGLIGLGFIRSRRRTAQ